MNRVQRVWNWRQSHTQRFWFCAFACTQERRRNGRSGDRWRKPPTWPKEPPRAWPLPLRPRRTLSITSDGGAIEGSSPSSSSILKGLEGLDQQRISPRRPSFQHSIISYNFLFWWWMIIFFVRALRYCFPTFECLKKKHTFDVTKARGDGNQPACKVVCSLFTWKKHFRRVGVQGWNPVYTAQEKVTKWCTRATVPLHRGLLMSLRWHISMTAKV